MAIRRDAPATGHVSVLVLIAACVASRGGAAARPMALPIHLEPTVDGRGAVAWGAGFSVDVAATEVQVGDPAVDAEPIRIRLIGANPEARMVADETLPGTSSYYSADATSPSRSCVPHLARVTFVGAWPGVDVAWRVSAGAIECDFDVAPRSDLAAVRLVVDGADARVVGDDIAIPRASGLLLLRAPVAWEMAPKGRRPIGCRFVQVGPRTFGFDVPDRSADLPLVVDPVLDYSTWLGTPNRSSATSVHEAQDGATWVAGGCRAGTFSGWGAGPAGTATFVAKISAAGDTVLSALFIEGGFTAQLAVGSDDDVYLAARDRTSWPIVTGPGSPPRPCDEAIDGACDSASVARIAADGSTLLWCRRFGLTGCRADAIAVDATGRVGLGGHADGDCITPVNAAQPTRPVPDPACGGEDGWVAELSSDGATTLFATYLGGTCSEFVIDMDMDAGGNIIVTGSTDSTDFPWVAAAQPFHAGPCVHDDGRMSGTRCQDVFVTKLAAGTGTIVYSTALGSADQDYGEAVAADPLGSVVVTGMTVGAFPLAGPLPPKSSPSYETIFVSRLSSAGAVEASHYLAGSRNDQVADVALDSRGRAHVAGPTNSQDFPVVNGPDDATPDPADPVDAWVARLSSDLSTVEFSTHFGGAVTPNGVAEIAYGVAAAADGSTIACGYTMSADLPTTSGAVQEAPLFTEPLGSGAFLVRYLDDAPTVREPSAIDLRDVTPLTVQRPPGTQLVLGFEETSGARQGLYSGTLRSLWMDRRYDHLPVTCDLGLAGPAIPMPAGNVYFLVVDHVDTTESSYGRDSFGRERPPSTTPCS